MVYNLVQCYLHITKTCSCSKFCPFEVCQFLPRPKPTIKCLFIIQKIPYLFKTTTEKEAFKSKQKYIEGRGEILAPLFL